MTKEIKAYRRLQRHLHGQVVGFPPAKTGVHLPPGRRSAGAKEKDYPLALGSGGTSHPFN